MRSDNTYENISGEERKTMKGGFCITVIMGRFSVAALLPLRIITVMHKAAYG